MKILVLAPRGLHLGFVGCYGNDWTETPALDHLAAEGVVFDAHFADCPDTAGARRAWRTGRWGLPLPGGEDRPTDEQPPDLLALLAGQGIQMCLVADESRPAALEFAAGWARVFR